MRTVVGYILFVAGALLGYFYFSIFNTSVPGSTGDVVNFSLLSDRLCGIIAAAAILISGAILMSRENKSAA